MFAVVDQADRNSSFLHQLEHAAECLAAITVVVVGIQVHIVSPVQPFRISVIISHAWGQDLDERHPATCPGMFQTTQYQLVHLIRPRRNCSGQERCALNCEAQHHRIERTFVRRSTRLLLGGRVLSLGQAINAVVHYDIENIGIVFERMYQVATTDRIAIAVSRGRDDGEVRVRQRRADGGRHHPAVHRVIAVGTNVVLHRSRASYAGQDQRLVQLDASRIHRILESVLDTEMPATRTPDR